MSTERVEIIPDETPNPSLEEQAKQQEQEANAIATEEQTSETVQEDRPEWLPEKFASAEDLAKAYSELEKKVSSKEPNDPSIQDARKVAEENQQAENTLEPFYAEYQEKGELSEKSYADLAKMGLDKNLVDGYIAGQKAIADTEVKMVHEIVGGEENYSKVIDWAKDNLNQSEQDAFNATLDSGTIEQVKFAVQAIASRAGISGDKPQMIDGDTTASIPEMFESVAQVTQAMNDPRYDKDPAYRKKVEDKLARSSVI